MLPPSSEGWGKVLFSQVCLSTGGPQLCWGWGTPILPGGAPQFYWGRGERVSRFWSGCTLNSTRKYPSSAGGVPISAWLGGVTQFYQGVSQFSWEVSDIPTLPGVPHFCWGYPNSAMGYSNSAGSGRTLILVGWYPSSARGISGTPILPGGNPILPRGYPNFCQGKEEGGRTR